MHARNMVSLGIAANFLLGLLGIVSPAHAETPAPKAVAIVHTPPQVKELPYPGQPTKLAAKLTGTKATEGKLRLALVRDGRYMEVTAKPGYLNEADQPFYEFSVPAPLAEMSYQLILTNPDGSFVVAPERYRVRRSCQPSVNLAEFKIPPEVEGAERLQRLVDQMGHLEKDLLGYEQTIKLLERTKEALQ